MTKLSVVVTCSNRKSLPPAPGLRAGDLPPRSMTERSERWLMHLAGAPVRRTLTDLYQGESWSVVPSVLRAASDAGFQPRLLVASAGLGLREATFAAPGYAATFSPGSIDSVGEARDEHRQWWHLLRGAPGALDPHEELHGRVLLVLSESYAAALHGDLVALGRRGDDVLVVGGATDVPGLSRLPSDRRLRQGLGGTATSLNLRIARTWLERLETPILGDPAALEAWQEWAKNVRVDDSWHRQVLTDDEVVTFIRTIRLQEPSLTRTRTLRRLRDSGHACEQTRFASLFVRAAGTA